MKTRKITLAIAAVLSVTVMAAACLLLFRHDVAQSFHALSHTAKLVLWSVSTLAFGTTVIQTWPIAGTFPTAAQAFNFNTQISRVVFADADTTATLTHNWGISAAQLAAFFPLIDYYAQNVGTTGTTLPQLTFALTDSNTVTITKTAATGSGGTFVVTLNRPYSTTE